MQGVIIRRTPIGGRRRRRSGGLDFVSARYGDVLVISTKSEISYIHHYYVLESVALRVPANVEIVREPRKLSGDGRPDLEAPKP